MINGTAFFRNSTFQQGIKLVGTYITQDIYFEMSKIYGQAEFNRLKVGGNAYFDAASFNKATDFSGAKFPGALHLLNSIFQDDINFNDAYLGDLYFRDAKKEEGPKTPNDLFKKNKSVRLTGTVFRRIHATNMFHEGFVDGVSALLPSFDPQPYLHLENVYRTTGYSDLADKLHYLGRKYSGNELKLLKTPFEWHRNLISRYFFGYWVKPWRLMIFPAFTLMFFFLGWWYLSQPDAVDNMEPLSCLEAFWASLNYLLPGIELIAKEWKPSNNTIIIPFIGTSSITYIDIVRIERLVGWITIPISLIAISGLFKPRTSH